MTDFLTTVPTILGKPINVWLGLALLVLVAVQVTTGKLMRRGRPELFPYHQFNAMLIVTLILVHGYYGIAVWFFGVQYAK